MLVQDCGGRKCRGKRARLLTRISTIVHPFFTRVKPARSKSAPASHIAQQRKSLRQSRRITFAHESNCIRRGCAYDSIRAVSVRSDVIPVTRTSTRELAANWESIITGRKLSVSAEVIPRT